jgi:hypothetical protein
MRYVHHDDWGTDICPGAVRNLVYPLSAKDRHVIPPEPEDGYQPGDRTDYMQCLHCDAVIWGFWTISEEEEPW